MNKLKKGPEINFSKLKSGDLKVPSAISDLYRELKGQHLLPIVVLLVIALIAIPILIGGSSDHPKEKRVATPAAAGSPSSEQAAIKVTRWTPGLLDYKKSLRGTKPSNPFAAKIGGEEVTESTSGEPAPAPSEIEVPSEPGTGGAGGEGPTEAPAPRPEETSPSPGAEKGEDESGEITVDVQITTVHEDGGIDRSPVRRDLPKLTKLPSEALPALTYVGPSEDGTKAMMAVSSEVTAMIGDSNCVVPAKPCSLLALQLGKPETIVYGARGLTYRIELVRIGEHTNSAGQNGKAPHRSKNVQNAGPSPAPRGTDALIGVGSGHIANSPLGF